MNISVAMLCDFAQVRNSLLFVSSGGISQLRRPAFPAPIGVMLALAVEVSELEAKTPFQVQVRVENEDGIRVTELTGQLQIGLTDMSPGETRQIPLALDLRAMPLPSPGRYMIRISIPQDESAETCLSFRASLVPGPVTGMPSEPTIQPEN